jgi:hypothetical protein
MSRTNASCWIIAAFLIFLVSRPAHAQIGDKKTFVFGVDRALGFVSSKIKIDPDGPAGETTITRNDFSLLAQGAVVSPYSNPRFAFDYFVTNGLSIGGSIGYWSMGGEVKDGGNLPDQHIFTFAPRVGYGVMFGRVVGIWPRGGVTYFTGTSSLNAINANADVNGFGLNLDVPFVFSPMNHFAILAGPGVDLSLAGGGKVGNTNYDMSLLDLGVYVGFVGYI